MIDTSALARLAANVMTQMEDRFAGEGTCIRTACLLVEVDKGDDLDYLYAATEDRPYVLIAFLDENARRMEIKRDELEAQAEEGES